MSRHALLLRFLLVVLASHGLGGCIRYVGGARPVDPRRLSSEPGWTRAGETPFVRQTHAADCGPAALVMVAARHEVPLGLDEAIAAVPEPTYRGIRLADLREAARQYGLRAYVIEGDRDTLVHELEAGRPVIVGLLLRHRYGFVRSHYEVVIAWRRETDEFVTLDPAAGYRVRTGAALEAEWESAGRPAMVVLGPATPSERPETVAHQP